MRIVKIAPNRLFFRYFLLFAVNLIFFILILSGIIYFVFVQSFLSNQFFQANVSTLNEVSKSAEGYLKQADDVAKYFSIMNKELLSYQYKGIEINSSLVDFLDRQKQQMVLDDYIFSVYAYFPDSDVVMDLSKTTLYSPLPKYNKNGAAGAYPRFYDNGWIASAKAGKFNRDGFILLDTRKVLDPDLQNTAYPETNIVADTDAITVIRAFDNIQASPRGYAVVNLNENYVSNYITQVNANPKQNTFIINSSGNVVSDSNVSLLGKSIADQDYIRTILGSKGKSGHFIGSIGGQSMDVMYVKSDYVGWCYVSTVPLSYLTKDLNYLNNVILLIVGLILASAVASVFLMARRIYSPIEGIFEKIKNISADSKVQMMKSEVKMVDSLLDGIKQNYDHLGKLVFDNFYLLKYDFLNRLLNGECDPVQMEAGFREYSIRFGHDTFTVACVAIDHYETLLKQYKLQELYLLNQAIIRILEEYFNEQYTAVGVNTGRNMMAVIINSDQPVGRQKLAEIMQSVFEMVQKYMNVSVSAGFGEPRASLESLKDSYEQAGSALRNRMSNGSNNLVFYDEISREEELIRPTAFEEQIITAVKAGQKDRCLQALDDTILKIRERNVSRQKVESLFTELVLVLHKQLNYQDKNLEDICRHTFPEMLGFITSVETLDGLRDYMSETLSALCEHFNSNKKIHNAELVSRVIRHIETNYSEDLSLEGIAATLKLTPQYVRKLVKDISGLNLMDYLTEIRIKKAEELLLKSDLSVQEISEKVGYACYRTFLQHFRERTGKIPTQYRKEKNRFVKNDD